MVPSRRGPLAMIMVAALVLTAGPTLLGTAQGDDGGDLETIEWTQGMGPIVLSSSMEVTEGQRLVIGPGVIVRLDPDVGIQVKGELWIEGTAQEPVRFVPNITGPMMPDIWAEIRLHSLSAGNEHRVRWAVFEGADAALVVNSANVTVEDSVFRTCRYGILSRANATVDVLRCTFVNNSALGLEWETGAGGTATDCNFTDNVVGVYCYSGSSPQVMDSTFTNNYHHLSFARDSNGTVVNCVLEDAIAEHLECYWNSSPILEGVDIRGGEEARIFLRDGCRPRFVGGTPVSTLRVDGTDEGSYAVAAWRIHVEVRGDDGRLLEGANVTLRGASGDLLLTGTTAANGRVAGLMSTYTVGSDGGGDRENPHVGWVQWRGHSQGFTVDPRDLDSQRVLALELTVTSPEPDHDPWFLLVLAVVVVLACLATAWVIRRQLRSR